MASRIHSTTFDAADPLALARWWQQVLGGEVDPDEEPDEGQDGYEAALEVADHLTLLFIRVPEPKRVKNRVHLDLQPTDRTRDAEVARLVDLGAEVLDDRRNDDGSGWVVLGDPEGNECCVVRSEEERAPAPRT